MGRAPCCDKANVKKGPWSPEEDAKLKSYIHQHGTGGNWIALPQKIGLKRCGKSCRLRWLNYLRPNLKHGGFSEEEDNIICSLYISIGSRWSIIAAQLPGRTDNDIKNYWNTRLKKKLLGKQRKEKHGSQVSGGHFTAAQLPVLPPIPYSNQEPGFNDHSSIRKLLLKLGGRFSGENQINEAALIQPAAVYEPYIDTTCISRMLSEPSVDLAEFEGIMYENPRKVQGLEFLYDDFMNIATVCGESMEMNPLNFAASSSNNTNQGEEFAAAVAVDPVTQ